VKNSVPGAAYPGEPEFIPVYRPSLAGNEKKYVIECLDSTWISSKGKFLPLFEEAFGSQVGVGYATAVANGTVAIHLALEVLGVGPGDEVIVPTLTYIASVNPIVQCGATPIFVDSRRDSWQLDPDDIRRRITPRTRAIMAVHLYGHPADMQAIMAIAKEHDLLVVEDCAEAFGSRIGGRHVGTFGDVSAFSFFGNKTVTTGEGGMVAMNDPALYDRDVHLKGQGLAKGRTYWHDLRGFNYRMTNICAAIGLAQLERAEELIARKCHLAEWYDERLTGLPLKTHRPISSDILHTYWMYSILVDPEERDGLMRFLAGMGIETRPLFYPVHTMPMYSGNAQRYEVAEELAASGINLPSWPDLTEKQVERIAAAVGAGLAASSVRSL